MLFKGVEALYLANAKGLLGISYLVGKLLAMYIEKRSYGTGVVVVIGMPKCFE